MSDRLSHNELLKEGRGGEELDSVKAFIILRREWTRVIMFNNFIFYHSNRQNSKLRAVAAGNSRVGGRRRERERASEALAAATKGRAAV